jgi:protein archease
MAMTWLRRPAWVRAGDKTDDFRMEKLPNRRGPRARGHRTVPHTADLRIEAWGPTREDCIAEAVRGLVDSFADIRASGYQQVGERHLASGSDADLVAAAIDEVIYRLDARGEIPAAVEVSRARDGGIDLKLFTVQANTAQIIGAAPKAASMSGLTCAANPAGQWSCAVTVDV